MKGYLSIGDVSRKKGVSIKSLRYYDQIGVLRPAYINEKTHYRYYTEEQLYLLDAIGLCIELGIPLRDFEKYRDARGNFNLQELLYDGKLLAEQKIMDIRSRLATVQTALASLQDKPAAYRENSTPGNAAPPDTLQADGTPSSAISPDTLQTDGAAHAENDAQQSAASLAEGFYRREIAARAILAAPFSETDLDSYSQQILRLFMLAQLLGLSASYPSGILYEYDADGSAEAFIFIQVENYEDCTDKRLHILPAGAYFCKQGTRHGIMDHASLRDIFQLSGKPFIVAECDLIDDDIKKEDNSLELQLLRNV